MKPKILIISAHPPLQFSKEAGQKLFFDFIKTIAEKYEIYLIAFARKEEFSWGIEEAYRICKNVKIITSNKFIKIAKILGNVWLPVNISSKKSKKVKNYLLNGKDISFERVHFEWEQMIQYAPLFSNKKITVTCHDVLSQMYQRKKEHSKYWLSRLFYWYQEKRILTIEKKLFRQVDRVVTLNNKDKDLIKSIDTAIDVEVIPPKIQVKYSNKKSIKKYDLVFFGAMNRRENQDGVVWFLKKIYPLLRSNRRLIIIGNNPSKKLENLAELYENVIVTGFVKDPYKFICQSYLGIVPLRMGAGIKIKTLEYLLNGVPTVSTSVGAEGIEVHENEGLFIEDTEENFAARINNLLDRPDELIIYGQIAAKAASKYSKDNRDKILSIFHYEKM